MTQQTRNMKTPEIKVISPFEFAIRQAANCEEGYRAETEKEKEERLLEKARKFGKLIKIKTP
jgi:hypothetical protein